MSGAYPAFECAVGYDVDVPCAAMTWKGYANTAQFREANERILAVIAERRARKLLGDIREFVLIGAEDQDWLSADWIPRAMAAGLRTVALVMPVFYFNRVAVQTVGDRLDPEALILQYFDTPASARAWLGTV